MYGRAKFIIAFLRIAMGWMFLYSGFSKIASGNWSAAGYLKNAQTFPELYGWFASPANLPWVNFVNEWGQLLIGAALVLGIFVNIAAYSGVALMALYYLPASRFPLAGQNGYLVDEHVIYALALLLLARLRAGRYLGIEAILNRNSS